MGIKSIIRKHVATGLSDLYLEGCLVWIPSWRPCFQAIFIWLS